MDSRCDGNVCTELKSQTAEEAMACTKKRTVEEDIDECELLFVFLFFSIFIYFSFFGRGCFRGCADSVSCELRVDGITWKSDDFLRARLQSLRQR